MFFPFCFHDSTVFLPKHWIKRCTCVQAYLIHLHPELCSPLCDPQGEGSIQGDCTESNCSIGWPTGVCLYKRMIVCRNNCDKSYQDTTDKRQLYNCRGNIEDYRRQNKTNASRAFEYKVKILICSFLSYLDQ